jgi:hypothetical protein
MDERQHGRSGEVDSLIPFFQQLILKQFVEPRRKAGLFYSALIASFQRGPGLSSAGRLSGSFN